MGNVGVSLALFLCLGACAPSARRAAPPPETAPLRDINAVLRDHDDELLKISGVVGVYVGQLDDGKTACLKVMVVRKTPELTRKVPRSLEGHPVVVEETGEIRPLRK